MKIKAHREPLTAFNMISLTDIIFLLLVFFLLSSTFVLQPGIKVQLPTTTTADISSEKSIDSISGCSWIMHSFYCMPTKPSYNDSYSSIAYYARTDRFPGRFPHA